ncbi:FecCD family ABC transporter permease [Microbacterium sp.]|uniref:FecCD family ABC transporter permease n=1 Tax=Microbacterium sp. TaxID=51671 RepID=UPI003A888704
MWLVVGAAITLVVSCVVSLGIGAFWIPLPDVVAALLAPLTRSDVAGVHSSVVWDIRMVRVLLAAAVGAALAVSGAAFQATFRNPLVEPYVLGVSSGAAFGAGVAIVITAVPFSAQGLAFVGGLLAVAVTFAVSRVRGDRSTLVLVLAGIVVGSFFMAMFSLFQYAASDAQLRRLVFWVMGGFYTAQWDQVALAVPVTIAGVLVLSLLGWRLNILSLGDEECRALGVAPRPLRLWVVVAATALTAIAVSVSGIIAWVGLLIPHAARFVVGVDNRVLIPFSAMLGAAFLVACDDIARTIYSGELPIGIITSVLGAPLLIVLLRRRTTHWGNS